jgi:hypothetical protein
MYLRGTILIVGISGRALKQYDVSARHHPVGSIHDGGEDASVGLQTHSCKGSGSSMLASA